MRIRALRIPPVNGGLSLRARGVPTWQMGMALGRPTALNTCEWTGYLPSGPQIHSPPPFMLLYAPELTYNWPLLCVAPSLVGERERVTPRYPFP